MQMFSTKLANFWKNPEDALAVNIDLIARNTAKAFLGKKKNDVGLGLI